MCVSNAWPLPKLAPDSCVYRVWRNWPPLEYVSDGAMRCQALGQEATLEHVVDSAWIIVSFASRSRRPREVTRNLLIISENERSVQCWNTMWLLQSGPQDKWKRTGKRRKMWVHYIHFILRDTISEVNTVMPQYPLIQYPRFTAACKKLEN
jgi:hypothetical protein